VAKTLAIMGDPIITTGPNRPRGAMLRAYDKTMEDVSTYPALVAEMLRRGYSDADVEKIIGRNILRAMRGAERVAAQLHAAALRRRRSSRWTAKRDHSGEAPSTIIARAPHPPAVDGRRPPALDSAQVLSDTGGLSEASNGYSWLRGCMTARRVKGSGPPVNRRAVVV